MRTPRAFEGALVAAALLHAGLFVALALQRRHRVGHEGTLEARAPREIELELEPPVEEPEVQTPRPPLLPGALPPSSSPVKVEARRGSLVASSLHSAPAPAEGSPEKPPEPDAVVSSSGDGWSFSPLAAAPTLGLAPGHATGPAAVGFSGRVGEEPAPGAGAIESVRDALDARDHDVGLGPGGPLVNLARDSVRDGLVPSISHALFELSTDGAGVVLSVRVLDASSDRKAWDDVAASLAAKARAHPLRVPPGAKGVAVTLRVDSVVRTKSAHDAGETAINFLGVPVKKSRAPHPITLDVSIPIISGNIDPTDALMDATSKPERIVSAWVVAERRL